MNLPPTDAPAYAGDGSCPHDQARREWGDKFAEAFWWNQRNLVVRWCREHLVFIEVERGWRPPRRAPRSRPFGAVAREIAARVVVEAVASDVCGVCLEPLWPGIRWPDPRATTVGHEPPLSRTSPGDVVVRRPEHWACNLRKGTRTDDELTVGIWGIIATHDVRADIRGSETPGDSR